MPAFDAGDYRGVADERSSLASAGAPSSALARAVASPVFAAARIRVPGARACARVREMTRRVMVNRS